MELDTLAVSNSTLQNLHTVFSCKKERVMVDDANTLPIHTNKQIHLNKDNPKKPKPKRLCNVLFCAF